MAKKWITRAHDDEVGEDLVLDEPQGLDRSHVALVGNCHEINLE